MYDVKYSQIWKSSGCIEGQRNVSKTSGFRLEFDIQSFIIKIWIVNKGSAGAEEIITQVKKCKTVIDEDEDQDNDVNVPHDNA